MESLNDYHFQLKSLMEKFTDDHCYDTAVDLSHNGVTESYYKSVSEAAQAIANFYKGHLSVPEVLQQTNVQYGFDTDTDVKLALIIDVLRCYDGLGHSTSFNTPEGIAIMIFLGKIYEVERIYSFKDLADIDSGTVSLIDIIPYIDQCSHEMGNTRTLLISTVLGKTSPDLDKLYRKLIYKLCKSIASVDGNIAIEEKEWLEEIAHLDDDDVTNDIEIEGL